MIKSVKIENYKSIQSLELDVGRFNVIIGENGAGKSNFLEALVLFGAAEANKLDNEFLVSRGVRVGSLKHMFSLFKSNDNLISITLRVSQFEHFHKYQFYLADSFYQKIQADYFFLSSPDVNETLKESKTPSVDMLIQELIEINYPSVNKHTIVIGDNKDDEYFEKIMPLILKKIEENETSINNFNDSLNRNVIQKRQILNFLLYSPENTALRNFYREGQIEPLGINGEGLLKLLKVMQESEQEAFADVLTCLELFDWFEQMDVPKDLTSLEDKVNIKDKYLSVMFDQRSANEGFLFVLFYAALFCSQYTPKIFAIDNIDASFNPKLCTAIIKKLVELAKKYDKQVFVTTHNPAILDGIDLGDEEQKILVASRNKQGHTRFKALTREDKPKSSTGEPIRLSEAFLRGYLGGLPKNF